MNKTILSFITIGIFLISSVSAIELNISSGENVSFDIGQKYAYYSIVGNSSPIDINISQEGNIVTIVTNKYNPSDSFEIIFYNSKDEVIPSGSSGGSGGSSSYVYKMPNNTYEVKEYDPADYPRCYEGRCYFEKPIEKEENKFDELVKDFEKEWITEHQKKVLLTIILSIVFIALVIYLIKKARKKK